MTEGGDYQQDSRHSSATEQWSPYLAQFLLNFFVGKDEVSHEKENQVEQRFVKVVQSVYAIWSGVVDTHLSAKPEEDAQQDNPRYVQFAADGMNLVFRVQFPEDGQ